jgi:hypothetical protein
LLSFKARFFDERKLPSEEKEVMMKKIVLTVVFVGYLIFFCGLIFAHDACRGIVVSCEDCLPLLDIAGFGGTCTYVLVYANNKLHSSAVPAIWEYQFDLICFDSLSDVKLWLDRESATYDKIIGLWGGEVVGVGRYKKYEIKRIERTKYYWAIQPVEE